MKTLLSLLAVCTLSAAASAQCPNCGSDKSSAPPQPAQLLIQRPGWGLLGIRQRCFDRRFSPRAVAVQVQPYRYIPGRWVPVQR